MLSIELGTEILKQGTKLKLVMRFCAILILSVISILNSLELKSQTVVNILSNGYKLERSLFNGSLKFEITAKRLYAASQRVL